MTTRLIRTAISVSAVALIVVHAIRPNWTLDGVTLGLFIVAVLPWLAPLFKSLEFPGGWKVEFRDLERARQKADRAGLLTPSSRAHGVAVYPFELIAEGDPNLALAGLRIEIERRLRALAKASGIDTGRAGIGRILASLVKMNALSSEERSVLADMLSLLNSAVHGADVDPRAAGWAMEVGPQLLRTLDERVPETAR